MEISFQELRSLLGQSSSTIGPYSEDHYVVGKPYMVHTVTGFYKGILDKVTQTEFVLSEASWVADTGKFSNSVENDDNVSEEEPFGKSQKLIINRGSMVIAYQIPKITRKLK